MDPSRTPHFAYLGDELILNQFSILAENIQKAIGTNVNNAGIVSMTRQIQNIKQAREKWPSKILQTFKARKVPVMAVEHVTKLNQSHCSRIEFINDDRKRSKESLRADISRKKKLLDDLQSKRDKMLDGFEAQLSQQRNERLLYQQNSVEFRRISGQIAACIQSYNAATLRLQTSEYLLQQERSDIEAQFLPI